MRVYRSVGCRGRADMTHRSHRGAACRATRFGGEVIGERVLVTSGITARRMSILRQVRAAAMTAIAVHEMLSALAECGVRKYDPANHICGVVDGKVNLTGLGWATGTTEPVDGYPIDAIASAFAE